MRKIDFTNQEYYHIYNRGVDKRDIFLDEDDFVRFLNYMKQIANSDSALFHSVEFICYCLNPNHFHFILKQLRENGISEFMHFLATAYTMYFNTKYQRNGSLFQGPFKAIEIKSFEDLLWLSVYVNTNAQIHGIIEDASQYPWCSYPGYLGIKDDNLCNKDIILKEVKDYRKFASETALFMKEKKEMEKYLIE